jgi:hypothetical protein
MSWMQRLKRVLEIDTENCPERRLGRHDGLRACAQYRSCYDAEAAAISAIIDGEFARAQREADYLAGRGYRSPGYLMFCRWHALCSP